MINSNTKYAYSVGKIRALETRLINPSQMEKVWQQTGFNSAAGFFEEKYELTNFAEDNFEYQLNEHLGKTIKTLKDIAVECRLFGVFLLKYDFHNFKVLSKNLSDSFIVPSGNFSKEELTEMFKAFNFSKFNEISDVIPLRLSAIFKSDKKTAGSQSDYYLEQLLFDVSVMTAKKYKNDFLVDFIKKQIDIKNLSTFYRSVKQKKEKDFLKRYLLANGYIDKEIFLTAFSNPTAIKIPQYEKLLVAVKNDFEKDADDFITEYIGPAKHISFGITPLIGYLWAKEIELKNVRIILYGKINNFEKEEVFAQLRIPYVQ